MDPLIGSTINERFRVLSEVASGGMGKIYRAEQIPLGRVVALKVLNPAYAIGADDDPFIKRFSLEASILARLQHPNIVSVFDYGEIKGSSPPQFFMAMEFLDGESLHTRFKKQRTLSVEAVLDLAKQMARGLREAHARGVVHRDLKPGNVMIIREQGGADIVKIVDFGLVKLAQTDDSEQMTREGVFLGSPRYVSPEQAWGGKIDARSDIYSFGIILFQALCGVVPFSTGEVMSTLLAHRDRPLPPMHEANPKVEVPEAVEQFVRRCLEKEPESRPANMDEVLRGIQACEIALGLASSSGAYSTIGAGPSDSAVVAAAQPEPPSAPAGDPTRVDTSRAKHPRLPAPSSTDGSPLAQEETSKPDLDGLAHTQGLRLPTLSARSSRLLIVVSAIVVGGGLLTAVIARLSTQAPAASTALSKSSVASFQLFIESEPSSADVYDGDTRLGQTPLQMPLDNDSLRTSLKRLSLRRAGWETYWLVQGPSERDVRVRAVLTPAPSSSASPSSSTPGDLSARAPVKPLVSAPTRFGTKKPDDIRTER
jgi:eukaryotic-like serine/threonine-protein kinase